VFFIFGTPRSGTTLLATTLDLHPEIVVPRETDFIVPLAFMVERVTKEATGKQLIAQFIVSSRYFPLSVGLYVKPAEVTEVILGAPYTAVGMLGALSQRVAQNAGKKLAGDKSPDDLSHLNILAKSKLIPSTEVKVIHLVRDVRDVALSLTQVEWGGTGAATYVLQRWSYQNMALRWLYPEPAANYLFVRYEDMVQKPAESFERITAFLGVAFQEQMLDHTRRGMALRHVKHHQHLQQPFQANRVGAWRKELSPELVALCEAHGREGLEVFGYR